MPATIAAWYETANEIGFIVRPAKWFRQETFRRIALEGVDGVSLVVGKLTPEHIQEGADPESMAAHVYHFAKDKWTLQQARQWIVDQKIEEAPDALAKDATAESGESVDVSAMQAEAIWEETENEIRYRVQDPADFRSDTFRTLPLRGIDGVRIIVGKLLQANVPEGNDPESMVVQSYRFDRESWDMERAMRWSEQHDASYWMAQSAIWDVAFGADKRTMKTDRRVLRDEIKVAAADGPESTDKRFSFILTYVGTNANGDHFTPDELRKAAVSAIGKKIDLSHAQEIRDIVGAIVESKYVEDGDASRVECVGELFTGDSESARLAYKLMKRGIVANVSMECAYAEGECSFCGSKHTSRANYCVHLRNYKAASYHDKPVFEILHNITFTGVGLLDVDGADPGAVIQQVASKENEMDLEQMKARIAELEAQLAAAEEKAKADKAELEAQVATLQAKVDELEGEKKAIARKARAEQLVETWQKKGRKFADDEAKAAELSKLEGMDDTALEALESAVASLEDVVVDPKDNKSDASKKGMKTEAKVGDPKPVPDSKPNFRNELSTVLNKLAGGDSQEG